MRQWVIDWVAALRSGNYEQGKEKLCRNGKYCCLGVLCELHDCVKTDYGQGIISFNGCISVLPRSLFMIVSIEQNGSFDPAKLDTVVPVNVCTLTRLNDSYGWTFEQIADLIEEIETKGAWL